MNSFFALSSGRMGDKRWASVSVLAESWLARPTKVRRSVRLVRVGNLEITSVMYLSMEYPVIIVEIRQR